MRHWMMRLLLLAAPVAIGAQQARNRRHPTTAVVEGLAARLVQVRVVEGEGAVRAEGTGFFVDGAGRLITSHHVLASWVEEPTSHRIEVRPAGANWVRASLRAVDVVSDLALLETGVAREDFFELSPVPLRPGDALLALGLDARGAMITSEGRFGGSMAFTLTPQWAWVGPMADALAGGPTITTAGRLVGVSIASVGEQPPSVVPNDAVAALIARADAPDYRVPVDFSSEIGEQLRLFQERFLDGMLEGEVPTVDLGRFRVVTNPSEEFHCRGTASQDSTALVETIEHRCELNDAIALTDDHALDVISLEHRVLRANGISSARFTRHVQRVFADEDALPEGGEDVTPWTCTVRNVEWQETTFRVSYCVRRHLRLGPLYDSVLRAVTLGDGATALVSTLRLSAVSGRNSEWLSTRFLEVVGWR